MTSDTITIDQRDLSLATAATVAGQILESPYMMDQWTPQGNRRFWRKNAKEMIHLHSFIKQDYELDIAYSNIKFMNTSEPEEILKNFALKFLGGMQNLDPVFSEIVERNIWDMI